MKPTLYLLYLDRERLGDRIFINDLAQRLHDAPPGDPSCLLVHGSGEKVERTLESQGFFPERTAGVLDVSEPAQVQLVERAVREANREVVAALTDERVPAVGIQGVDRRLLQMSEAGTLQVHRIGWVAALVKQRVVPVISALARDPEDGRVREVSAAASTEALAEALATGFEVTVVFLVKGRPEAVAPNGKVAEALPVEALPDDGTVPEVEAVRQLAASEAHVLLTNIDGLFAAGGAAGVSVRA